MIINDAIYVRDCDVISGDDYGYSCHDSSINPKDVLKNILSLLIFWSRNLSINEEIGILCFNCNLLSDADDVIDIVFDDTTIGEPNEKAHHHYLIKFKNFKKNKIKIKSSLSASGDLYISKNILFKDKKVKKVEGIEYIYVNKYNSFEEFK